MPRTFARLAVFVVLAAGVVGCRGPEGETVGEKKQFLRDFAKETVALISATNPEIKEKMDKAAGYAVFSSMNTYLFTFSSTNGFGYAYINAEKKERFMKVFGLGVGFGAGLKIFRELLIFETEAAIKAFAENGWELSAKAEGVGKVGDTEIADETYEEESIPGVKSYAITDTGVVGQASVHGTKYYAFDALENPEDDSSIFDMSEEEGGEKKK